MPIGPSDITIASQGANMGALRIMSRRTEEHIVRAMLRDLNAEGLVVVRLSDFEKGRDLITAISVAIKTDDDV
jgi:hypothetical protein